MGQRYVSCSHVSRAFALCQPSEGNGLKSGELPSEIHISDDQKSVDKPVESFSVTVLI